MRSGSKSFRLPTAILAQRFLGKVVKPTSGCITLNVPIPQPSANLSQFLDGEFFNRLLDLLDFTHESMIRHRPADANTITQDRAKANARAEWCWADVVKMQTGADARHPLHHDSSAEAKTTSTKVPR